jgi:hypothetical protein
MWDIVQGTGDSIAEQAFFGDLMASQAFIENLLTRFIRIHGDGQIATKNPDGTDWQGLGSGVPGFRFRARDGLIESNNLRTRDSEMEGTFVVGDAWDVNGNIVDPNSRGGLLARRSQSATGTHWIRVLNPHLHGQVNLGIPFGARAGRIDFWSRRFVSPHCYTEQNDSMLLSGVFTASQMFNELNSRFAAVHRPGVHNPISGSITVHRTLWDGDGNARSEGVLIIISRLDNPPAAGTIALRG